MGSGQWAVGASPGPTCPNGTLRIYTRNDGMVPAQWHGRIHMQCTPLPGPSGEKAPKYRAQRAMGGGISPQEDLKARRTPTPRPSWGDDLSPKSLLFLGRARHPVAQVPPGPTYHFLSYPTPPRPVLWGPI